MGSDGRCSPPVFGDAEARVLLPWRLTDGEPTE